MPQALVPDIDTIEAEAEAAPEPGVDVIPLPLPVPVYKALSDAAARKNMTVAQLLAKAIALAIKEN
jgi:predicted DNA-binding ribbon-helix-helix protein